jgi:hypothetical protein
MWSIQSVTGVTSWRCRRMPSYNPKLRTPVAAVTAVPKFRHYAVGTRAQNATQILNFFPPIHSDPFTPFALHSSRYSSLPYLQPTFIRRTSGHNLEHLDFFLNNQPDALIIQIYSVIKPYMFRASSVPIIRSFLLYIRHW